MGGITFINPFMFLGLLAVTIPVAIHLLTRRTPVIITFPSLRFLQKAQANQSRLFRIRHYLLLLVRTLIVMLILATFLRPVLTRGTLAATSNPTGGTAAIIIVDTSLSMGYSGGGISPLARATAAASSILGDLGASDLANVIYAGPVPSAVFEAPRPNRALLRADLTKEHQTLARADIDAAIALALEQFDGIGDHSLELHLVSDFQRTNWAAVDFSTIPESVKIVFVSVAEARPDNVALTGVSVRPTSPAAGEHAEVACTVANYGADPKQVTISFDLGGGNPQQQVVSVAPGNSAMASFPMQFDAPGVQEGTVRIGDDALPADDTRYLAFRVAQRFPITILTSASGDARGASSRFLAAALDPFGDGSSIFVPEILPPNQFDRFVAGRAHAVILTETGALSSDSAAALDAYLADGGVVIYFVDSPEDAANLALLAERTKGGIQLPFAPGGFINARPDVTATLASANYDDPILKKFRDTGALAELHFSRYYETRRLEAQGQILLKYDNGSIALARTTLGLGSILLANFSPALDASDLQKSTIFVPLIHEMVKALGQAGSGNREFAAGFPCSTTLALASANESVRFTSPDDKPVNAALDMNGANGTAIIKDTSETGFYRAFTNEVCVGSVAVNADARESNLESLTPEQLDTMTQRSRAQFFAQTGATAGDLRRLREGVPLWPYCLASALAFLALEQGFALVWRR